MTNWKIYDWIMMGTWDRWSNKKKFWATILAILILIIIIIRILN